MNGIFIFKDRLARVCAAGWLGALALVCLCSTVSTSALAHGERNQEPFLRMRTAQFYDMKWSTDKIPVNGLVTLTGKFRLFSDWPNNLPKPDMAFLGNGTPGPVLARVESYINGQPAIQSSQLDLDRDYEFKMVLKGRTPGKHHVHGMINVDGAGPLLGAGNWVEVTGKPEDFVLPATTLDGTEIPDLQTWGLNTVFAWHGVWFGLALVYMLWFLRKPMLIPRYLALETGHEDALVTRGDRLWGAIFLVATLLLVIGGVQWANAAYPRTLPLQAGVSKLEATPQEPRPVTVRLERATYDVPGRSMKLRVQVTNGGDKPVQVGEFTTAGLRFLNHSVPAAMAGIDPSSPKELIAPTGLKISDDSPIQPGETRTLELDATDVTWETERLTSLINDPDNRVGGLLFFFDPEGKRFIANVYGPIVPVFRQTARAEGNGVAERVLSPLLGAVNGSK